MSFERDHGVIPIRSTLTRTTRMNVDVGYNLQIMRSAVRPELAEVTPVEAHDARVEAVRVEIVIENVIDDPLPIAFNMT